MPKQAGDQLPLFNVPPCEAPPIVRGREEKRRLDTLVRRRERLLANAVENINTAHRGGAGGKRIAELENVVEVNQEAYGAAVRARGEAAKELWAASRHPFD